jgi:hypothetical protein
MEQEQQTPGDRALELIRVLLPDWQPTTQDVLRWIRLALAVGLVILGVLLILDIIGLLFGITLLNLLKVLAIPITVGAAVPLLNWLQKKREIESEDRRAQDAALQAYLDQMSQLLTNKDRSLHRAQQGDSLSTVARARTLTVLTRLDGDRKGSVVQFLYESALVTKDNIIVNLLQSNLSSANLSGANLQESKLSGSNLSSANLSGAYLNSATLNTATLSGAYLSSAILSGATLWGADLNGATLIGATLWEASLRVASLNEAHLNGSDLSDANLERANLYHANLRGANLERANLSGAKVTNDQLKQAYSLEGATMPDSQILKSDDNPDGPTFGEWLKSKRRGEDGEHDGTS